MNFMLNRLLQIAIEENILEYQLTTMRKKLCKTVITCGVTLPLIRTKPTLLNEYRFYIITNHMSVQLASLYLRCRVRKTTFLG